jgi:hypothetical protein
MEEHSLMVREYGNRALRKMFGHRREEIKRWRKEQNEKRHDLNSSQMQLLVDVQFVTIITM